MSVSHIKAAYADRQADSDARTEELQRNLEHYVTEIATGRGHVRHDDPQAWAKAIRCLGFLEVEAQVRAKLDRLEAAAIKKLGDEEREHRETLAAFKKDTVPGPLLRDMIEKLIGKLRLRVDPNQRFIGRGDLPVDEFVGTQLRGRLDTDELALLRCAANTSKEIPPYRSAARDFMRGYEG